MRSMGTLSCHWTFYRIFLQALTTNTGVINGNYADIVKSRNLKEAKIIPEERVSHINYQEYDSPVEKLKPYVNPAAKIPGKTPSGIEEHARFICPYSNEVVGLCNGPRVENTASLDLCGGPRADAAELETIALVKRFQKAKFSALLLDYDGTLVELDNNPAKAVPTEALKDALKALDRKYPSIQVSIISGRMKGFLEQHLGQYKNILLSAEHGAFVRKPGMHQWEARVAPVDKELAVVRHLMEKSVLVIPGSYVESKNTALVWHYKPAEGEEAAEREAKELINTLEQSKSTSALHVQKGHKIVEMKAKNSKGEIAVESCKAQSQATAILVMGDDFGDEPMFEAVTKYALLQGPEAFRALTTAIVNNPNHRLTKAQTHIPTVKASVNLLRAIGGLPTI